MGRRQQELVNRLCNFVEECYFVDARISFQDLVHISENLEFPCQTVSHRHFVYGKTFEQIACKVTDRHCLQRALKKIVKKAQKFLDEKEKINRETWLIPGHGELIFQGYLFVLSHTYLVSNGIQTLTSKPPEISSVALRCLERDRYDKTPTTATNITTINKGPAPSTGLTLRLRQLLLSAFFGHRNSKHKAPELHFSIFSCRSKDCPINQEKFLRSILEEQLCSSVIDVSRQLQLNPQLNLENREEWLCHMESNAWHSKDSDVFCAPTSANNKQELCAWIETRLCAYLKPVPQQN